jgi:hypothetical protein
MPVSVTLHASAHLAEVDPQAFATDIRAAAPGLGEVRLEGDLLQEAAGAGRRSTARKASLALASARLRSALVAREYFEPAPGDESFELLIDTDAQPTVLTRLPGRLYDGERAAQAAMLLLPPEGRAIDRVHVWATRRLIVTYSSDDFRYHARYAVHGYPTLFSTLALRYAPAPSKESQVQRMVLARQGMSAELVEQTVGQAFAHESFDAADPALVTRALASAALQACAIAAGRRPFCTDAGCRLFNPHRSPEFIRSILGTWLCPDHRELFAAAPG